MNGKRLILVLGVVAFVVIMTIAIFSIDWGGSDKEVTTEKSVNIADFANTDTEVRMTVRGPVDNDKEHQEIQITVGRNKAVGELLGGYEGKVLRTEETASNVDSYKAFLSALHNANFTLEKKPPKGIQYDGACPRSQRFTFEFIGGQNAPKSLWATNCGKKVATFAGDLSLVQNLFEDQIPEDQHDALIENSQF